MTLVIRDNVEMSNIPVLNAGCSN